MWWLGRDRRLRLLLGLSGRVGSRSEGVTVVITQEAARKRLEIMEKLARAHVELLAATEELRAIDEKFLAVRIADCASLVVVTKMQLRESIAE